MRLPPCCDCQRGSSTPGVKANVLFFDRKPAVGKAVDGRAVDLRPPHQQALHPEDASLTRADLNDFVYCYMTKRRQPGRDRAVQALTYEELLARDKASLDIFWLRDESLEDTDNLPAPEVIAAEIVEDLQAALDQFSEIATTLSAGSKIG